MMRKFWTVLLMSVLLLGAFGGSALAQVTSPPSFYSFQVQVTDANSVKITTGRCRVLTAATYNTDAPSIFSDSGLVTASTTLTAAGWAPTIALDSNGVCAWYAATGTNSFDAIVYIDSGQYAGQVVRVDGVTRTGVKRVVLPHLQTLKHFAIPFLQNAATQTSTIKLPGGFVALQAVAEVVTAVAASTVSFGYAGGSVTSFCNAQSAATAGFQVCSVGLSNSVGTASSALTYQTSAHAVAGFVHIWGLSAGD